MDSTFWLNLGIAGAVVAVVNLFLRHLRRERASCDGCRSAQTETTREFGRIVANHLAHERESLEKLAEAVRDLEHLLRDAARKR